MANQKNQPQEQEKTKANIEVVFRDGKSLKYKDILGYQVGGGAVGISLKDGATHVFPLDLVEQVVHQVEQ